MTQDLGIIDLKNNPFAIPSWINQAFSLTSKRQDQLFELLHMDINHIRNIKDNNESNYVAFVAIRWGFAKIINNKLTLTAKWIYRQLYDGFGNYLNKN